MSNEKPPLGAANAQLILNLAALLGYDLSGDLLTDLVELNALVTHMLVMKFDEELQSLVAPTG